MPCRFRIDPVAGLITEYWYGVITAREIAECHDVQTRHPHYCPTHRGLSDLTEALPVLSFEQLKGVASGQSYTGAWAFIAPDDATFGTLRMYEVANDGRRPVRVFRTRAEAEAWLEEHKPVSVCAAGAARGAPG